MLPLFENLCVERGVAMPSRPPLGCKQVFRAPELRVLGLRVQGRGLRVYLRPQRPSVLGFHIKKYTIGSKN